MTLSDVKDAVLGKLRTAYPTYKRYTEEIKQGFTRPAFFVQVLPVTDSLYTKRVYGRSLMIVIQCFPAEKTNAACFAMADQLKELFLPAIQVLDRHITIPKVNAQAIDKVLHCSFNLDFKEELPDNETCDLMQEVNFNQTIKGE